MIQQKLILADAQKVNQMNGCLNQTFATEIRFRIYVIGVWMLQERRETACQGEALQPDTGLPMQLLVSTFTVEPPHDLQALRAEARELVKFAVQLARDQLRGGRRFIIENPLTSEAWMETG